MTETRIQAAPAEDVVVTANPIDDSVHLLPLTNQTAHDLTATCWCEPTRTVYVPRDHLPDERYEAWNHNVAN